MNIFVCSIDEVPSMIEKNGITHVISLIKARNLPDLNLGGFNRQNWLHIDVEDEIEIGKEGGPTMDHLQTILEFVDNLPEDSNLLVHCIAGVSRSPAVALIAHLRKNGDVDESIQWLFAMHPYSCPNPVFVSMADKLLKCNGKLFYQTEEFANRYAILLYQDR